MELTSWDSHVRLKNNSALPRRCPRPSGSGGGGLEFPWPRHYFLELISLVRNDAPAALVRGILYPRVHAKKMDGAGRQQHGIIWSNLGQLIGLAEVHGTPTAFLKQCSTCSIWDGQGPETKGAGGSPAAFGKVASLQHTAAFVRTPKENQVRRLHSAPPLPYGSDTDVPPPPHG